MKKPLLLLSLLLVVVAADAQTLSVFKRILKKTSLLFTSENDYKGTTVAVAPFVGDTIPTVVDFEPYLPPVGDQLPQHSCVAWAIAYGCRSYYVSRQAGFQFITDKKTIDYSGIASPAFIYNLMNQGQNKPTSLYWALHLLMDTGVCSWESMPYRNFNWKKKPQPWQIKEAADFRIKIFSRIDLNFAVKNLKGQLAAGTPVIIGTVFDKDYYNAGFNARNDFYLWETLQEVDENMGHAVLLVGYNDSLQAFKFMNSWGKSWGSNGYGYISYLLAPQVIAEAYVIKPKDAPKRFTNRADTINVHDVATAQSDSIEEVIFYHSINAGKTTALAEYGIRIYADSVALGKTAPTDDLPNGETEISLHGMLSVPAELNGNFQIVVQFYLVRYGDKGPQVFSLNEEYQLANGYAATCTNEICITGDENVCTGWSASIPLSALDIPTGMKTDGDYLSTIVELIAEPVLFMDRYAICTGKYMKFKVKH